MNIFWSDLEHKQTSPRWKGVVPSVSKGASLSHIKCQCSSDALFRSETLNFHDWGCFPQTYGMKQPISNKTLTHFAVLFSADTTCCVEVASYSCVLVSKAAESLVSLNYRYKHNYFLKKKGTNLLQCSPLTGNLYVLCVFLRQCFCGSKLYSVNTYYCLL